jgi:iron complex outermembrane receptor protein
MSIRPGSQRIRVLLAVAGLAAGVTAGEVRGQDRLPPAVQAGSTQAARVHDFDISAKPLPQALNDIGRIAGLSIVFTATRPFGVTGRPVRGMLTAPQALATLLAGTGIGYRFTNARTVTIEPPSAPAGEGAQAQAVQLDAIEVIGEGGEGFVATRSSGGTKTNTPLIETPQAISVVTREQLERQKVQTVAQALRYTPGITADYRGSVNRYDVIYARGFGGFYLQHLDGMKLMAGQYAIPQIDPYNLERIEVLRGPSSVLYGQNNPGGIINLVSKRPTAEPLREIQVQGGSFDRIQGAFDLGGPLDKEGHWLYRLTGLALDADTQVDFTGQQRVSISPALTWRPSLDTTLTILSNYQQDPKAGYFGFVPAQGTFLPNPNGRIRSSFYDGDPSFDDFDRKQASIGYLFEHRFDETWTVRQNLRYQHVDVYWARVASRGLQANLRTLNRQVVTDDETFDGVTVDNQAQASFATGPLRHTLLMGVDYQHGRNAFDLGSATTLTLDAFNPVYYRTITPPPLIQSTTQTQTQLGIYAQDQVRLGKWALLLGGRHDWADSKTENRLPTTTTTVQSDNAFTGRAGLVYLFDNGLAPYASYSTSFQPVAGTGFGGAPFLPTTGEQYEVGVKYQPPGINAFVTLSAFDLTQQNVLTPDPDASHVCAGVRCQIQTGEIASRGIEVEIKAGLAQGFDLAFAYTHLDPEVTKSNNVDLGKRPIGIPRNTAAAWADYTLQDGPYRGLGFGLGVRYVGPTAGDAANLYTVPSFTLVDAALRYDLAGIDPLLKGYRLAVNATNLFDREYVSTCIAAPNSCYYGLRRTVVATLTYRW